MSYCLHRHCKTLLYFIIGLTTDEILANALLFFVGGYDTTSTSLSFFMYSMALNPECQDKLVEEINKVVGDKVTSTPSSPTFSR